MAKNKVVNKTRRANGEGSICQRKDGRWIGVVSVGYDENGKAIRKTVYGKSQTEVAKKIADMTGRLNNNTYEIMEKKNCGELMLDWLMVFKKSSVSSRTFEGNIRNFKLHILPIIGNMKVYEIDTMTVQKLINNMVDGGYASDTIKKNKHILGQFFDYAIDNKWITVNPVSKIKLKSQDRNNKKEKYKALTPEIRKKFLEALNKDEANFIKPLCIVLMFSGLRIGEALALKWSNVDFENKRLKIEQAVTQDVKYNDKGDILKRITVIGETKTTCSVREIPIVDLVVEVLKEYKDKQKKKQKLENLDAELTAPNSFVFANNDGSVRTYSGCRVIFNRFLKRNKLMEYDIHFHGLRHTFSNMLFEMNENPKVIQQLLGHRDVKTTITVYNSVDNEYIRQTTDKLNERIKENNIVNESNSTEQDDSPATQFTDDELDALFEKLMKEREERKRKREKDFEM